MAKAKKKVVKKAKKKVRRSVVAGVAHIQATFNNTIVTITDPDGAVISWASGGKAGFKGSRKSTSFAAQIIAKKAGGEAKSGVGLQRIEVWLKGPGPGRDSAVRALQGLGLKISAIRDVTPVPHNGCRPPKRRRV